MGMGIIDEFVNHLNSWNGFETFRHLGKMSMLRVLCSLNTATSFIHWREFINIQHN